MAIQLDPVIDLGRDSKRMSPDDKKRQELTVDRLLSAFSGPPEKRREVQLLADEVGLGKTFVALATAYSLLRVVRTRPKEAENSGLDKTYKAAIVIVPSGNHALANKWKNEVEALGTRCSTDPRETDWFRSIICRTPTELVNALRKSSDLRRSGRENPCVLICTANIFTRNAPDPGDQLRFLAACLFRWWGNRLSLGERSRLIRMASKTPRFEHWAVFSQRLNGKGKKARLWDFKEHACYLSKSERKRWDWPCELKKLYEQSPIPYSEIAEALDSISGDEEARFVLDDDSPASGGDLAGPSGLLQYCKYAALRRGKTEKHFLGFRTRLLKLHKKLSQHLIRKQLPLVIVDEAHNWRNTHRQDCKSFKKRLAPFVRRLLLLTATPFQMHRDELYEILSVGDSMEPAIGPERVALLRSLREKIKKASTESEDAGFSFSREWGGLREQFGLLAPLHEQVTSFINGTVDPRTRVLKQHWEQVSSSLDPRSALSLVPGPLRPFFSRAVELRDKNAVLGKSMRELIIRHKRPVGHRRMLIGREYPGDNHLQKRPDQHLFHLALGAPVPPHAELAQYLLMKVVAEASRGRHRTTLGMDLTGCYTTLWESKEGSRAAEAATAGNNRKLLRILKQVTGQCEGRENREDHRHPKVQIVLGETLRRWDLGEKTLIFCSRIPTAKTLARLLSVGIQKRIERSRRALLESRGTVLKSDADFDRSMQQFRRSLTAREGSGVPLFLDRVLMGWFHSVGLPDPTLTEPDCEWVAELYARASVSGSPLFRGGDRLRLDRVFLNRAIENAWARRLVQDSGFVRLIPNADRQRETRLLLEQIADESWVRCRYGMGDLSSGRTQPAFGATQTDLEARSGLSVEYSLSEKPNPQVATLVKNALSSRSGGRNALVVTLVAGPNLFVPIGLDEEQFGPEAIKRTRRMRDLLFRMTLCQDEWAWGERAKVIDAVVRALLREDILLRLPQKVFREPDETWANGILRGLHAPPGGGQLEPLAGRVEDFMAELADMGQGEREGHIRYAMNPKAEAVVLVTGSSGADRDAVFNGFNTPLLPDILVCTQVGQEGIDLHRHCRHVVHYDMGWNPASIEQRTGRTDRLGSKAMRERKLAMDFRASGATPENAQAELPGLDIGLPYLAGTYDDRMFESLRSRAQAFEILTGGDPSADREDENGCLDPEDVKNDGLLSFVPLPSEMLDDLRVNLSVKNSK